MKYLQRLIPVYALVPLAFAFALNGTGYYGIQLLHNVLDFHDFSLPIDHRIPFVPAFIFIYLLAFAQWITGFVMCARESREFCFRFLSAETCAKALTLCIFILLPSTIVRPEITGTDLASKLTAWIYAADEPMNLLPSIHCLESWFCLRAAFSQKKTGKVYALGHLIMTLLVFASVLFVKQHVILDIVAGMAVFEFAFFLTRKKGLESFYAAAERRITEYFGRIRSVTGNPSGSSGISMAQNAPQDVNSRDR